MEMFCNQCEQAAHGTGCTKSFGIKPIGASPREDLLAILGHPVEV